MTRSLRRTLAVRFAATMAVGLVAMALALAWAMSRGLRSQLDQGLAASAFLATERLVHPAPEGVPPELLAGDPVRFAREVNRYIVLRDPDGTAVRAFPDAAVTLPVDANAMARARSGYRVWIDQRWNGRLVRSLYERVVLAGVAGDRVLQVSASLAPLRAALRELRLALAGVVLLGVGATLLGAWLVGRSAVRPVWAIAAQARQIQIGGPAPRIVAHADTDEYRGLVEVLNGMLERLDRAFRTQRRMTADVSHELRTPLTALRGEIEVALRTERAPADYQRVLRSALEEIDRLSRMSEDLLLITRAESGQLQLSRAPTDLDGLIRRALTGLRSQIEEKLLAVEPDFGNGAPVPVDPQLVSRLLTHLLENAVKFTPPGGRVRLVTGPVNGYVRLTVEDSGPGLGADILDHVFEPFLRADLARGRGTGTGLGLALARSVAELHGGAIRASNAPGGGARFEVDFPLAS